MLVKIHNSATRCPLGHYDSREFRRLHCVAKSDGVKLNFYSEIKEKYTFKKYLDFINNRKHKAALTNLRIIAHRLHTETGRYKKYDYNLRRYVNTPWEERTCSVCVNKIEGEYHFLFECEKIRR